jgi:nuclease S1
MIRLVLACLFGLLLTQKANAWGAAGHAIVAEIAQRRLTPEVLVSVKELLGGEISLASISNWADTIQLIRPETRRWHFVNIPVGAERYDPGRDCPDGACVVAAIDHFRRVLAEKTRPHPERLEALKFLVHLVADAHQPLHTAERESDQGGVLLLVSLFGEPTNLHAVWDFGLLDKRTYDWGEHVRRLEETWPAGSLVPEGGSPADWAWQAHEAAIRSAYPMPEDRRLDGAYLDAALPVVDLQLARAGARLARLLNEALR